MTEAQAARVAALSRAIAGPYGHLRIRFGKRDEQDEYEIVLLGHKDTPYTGVRVVGYEKAVTEFVACLEKFAARMAADLLAAVEKGMP